MNVKRTLFYASATAVILGGIVLSWETGYRFASHLADIYQLSNVGTDSGSVESIKNSARATVTLVGIMASTFVGSRLMRSAVSANYENKK